MQCSQLRHFVVNVIIMEKSVFIERPWINIRKSDCLCSLNDLHLKLYSYDIFMLYWFEQNSFSIVELSFLVKDINPLHYNSVVQILKENIHAKQFKKIKLLLTKGS